MCSDERIARRSQLLDRAGLPLERPPGVALRDRRPQRLDVLDQERAGRRALPVGRGEPPRVSRRVLLEPPPEGAERRPGIERSRGLSRARVSLAVPPYQSKKKRSKPARAWRRNASIARTSPSSSSGPT